MTADMSGLTPENDESEMPATDTPEAEAPTPDEVPAEENAAPSEETAANSEETAIVSETAPTSIVESPEGGEAAKPAPKKQHRRSQYGRGEIVELVIKEATPTEIIVELDERGEGFIGKIPGRELDRMNNEMLEMLKVGNTVKLLVVNEGDKNGFVMLSLNRALEKQDWEDAETYQKSREVYNGIIAGYNKGGLIVRFGRLRGFIPQSQISDERRARMVGDTPETRYGGMVKEEIEVKVIEVDKGRNRLILSERAAARETREKRKANLIEDLTLNEVREGRVVSLEEFGAFVDIGGAEGLVHLTELSWGHVTHPKQVLEVGQKINVEVISIDPDNKRIGLSLKRQIEDPWDIVASNYNQGQLVKGIVTKLTKFGAFAQLVDQPEVEGLVHISELAESRVAHPREVVEVGETLSLIHI